ncbi:thiamine biosynthesis lipoprotein [Mucilaginibacter yixingensis]|uniref:FAD:protein FMN transferase n=1 Tax=Mucilaginibacter yixingensis TaxID=1295612 RepID=A0A2T5J628_9SPHI|nr:FAD:protein FMN transferase [Mucilaginibacter yixingensis]PTQ93997.1 thiamine biosynthesis lipoprotein [Mucilaginibacter yixingensis]
MKRCLLLLLFFATTVHAQVLRKRTTLLMGGRFEITIVAKDSLTAEQNIDTCIKEISRIEYLISDWKPQTQVSEVNRNAGIKPVKVNREVFELTQRALKLSKATDGAFDISFAAMEKIWKFDGSMTEMPSPEAVKKSVAKVGYQHILLDSVNSTIYLEQPGMKIGFGALGEGYAGDRCRNMMLARGIKAGIINATGDMATWGTQPNGRPWNIGITNPFHPDTIFAVIPLHNRAMVTSGSYEKFVMLNGKRYAHIINPKTGYPASGLISVSITGPSAEQANGFSTSMMVLGKEKALQFIKKHPAYHYLIITDDGQIIASKSLALKTKLRLQ